MATVVYLWPWLADAMGMADQGVSASIAFAANPGVGNPADSVKFSTTTNNLSAAVERARRSSTGETWETWGVPAGATVTSLSFTLQRKQALDDNSSITIKARIVDSTGATVHSAGELISVSLGGGLDVSWQTMGPTARAVDAAFQASTTDVRLELEVTVTTSSSGTSVTFPLDNGSLTITYTPAMPADEIMAILNPRSYAVERPTVKVSPGNLPNVGIMTVGRLWAADIPDMRGKDWRAEKIASENADPAAAAILDTGAERIAIFTDRDQVFVARTGNPLDWTAGTKLNTGLTGRVYGAAMNAAGIICALIGSKWYLSRDLALTWTEGGTGPWPLPAGIEAVEDVFVVMAPTGATPKHYVSIDGGASWL